MDRGLDEAGYRFWIVVRDQVPILAIDQADSFAWTQHSSTPVDVMAEFKKSRRHVSATTLELLRRIDNIA